MLAAKKAGKTRYLGFTGHKSPAIHLKMVKAAAAHHFPLDAVQMPLNVMDAHFNSFEQQVLPELVRQGIGVLSMKSLGDHFILDTKLVTAEECWHYAMNLPISVMITGIDSLAVLDAALAAARSFRPMTTEQVAALRARTATAAAAGAHERYKTTGRFDGTAHHPEWLGPGGEMKG